MPLTTLLFLLMLSVLIVSYEVHYTDLPQARGKTGLIRINPLTPVQVTCRLLNA